MTAAYRTIPNPVYTNLHFTQKWQPASQHIFTILNYVHTYVPLYIFKVFSLHNIRNSSTCTMSRQILLCSSVLCTCTWKIVFKIEDNELNELSECMLYKMFCYSGKHLKNVKLYFTNIFQKLYFDLLAFKSL